ncbi:uncharacterized protein LOC135224539 [Macrobrachium nipponense]|uniref:uncharacterized protein LOC135224539 n=1 Tax=Macrobrachium nipponense TaxID=159736 RepID=UPI0030C8B8CA
MMNNRTFKVILLTIISLGLAFVLLLNEAISKLRQSKHQSCSITFDLGTCPCKRTLEAPLSHPCSWNTTSSQKALEHLEKTYGKSTCGSWASLRGPNQRVVSYSVYGTFPSDYYSGLEILIPEVTKTYPGWSVRVYHSLNMSDLAYTSWMCELACKYPHLDLCHTHYLPVLGNISRATARAWRFAVMGDPLVDWYVVRDVDSPILQREVDAVKMWLSSGTCFHVMRDHQFHGVPMLAGTWGGCGMWHEKEIRSIRDTILRTAFLYTEDQTALTNNLWQLAKSNLTAHDSYTCMRFPGSKPFPSQRVNHTYIGEKSYMKMFERIPAEECPVTCRPSEHPDWLYC